MRLLKLHLDIKLLTLLILISIVPIIINLLWFYPTLADSLTTIEKILFTTFVFLSTLIFVIPISIFFTKSISEPIKQLRVASTKLGEGNLDYRVSVATGDEIEELANGFNTMAENLKKSITTLREGQELISAERNKFAVVLSGVTDAVVAVDLDRKIIIFNSAAEKLVGMSAQEAIGKPIGEILKIYDGDTEIADTTYCPIRTDSFEGEVFSKKDIKLIGANDKEASINIIAGKIKEAVSIHLGCILTFHDITNEKSLEAMKLDFVSMAAHELRTPLTSLKGYLAVFIEDNRKLFNDEQMMFLTRMSISASQLTNLVENLLSVARIERGAFSVRTENYDWIEIVQKAVEDIMDRANDRKITLTFKEPESGEMLPKLAVDKLRIGEVLTNLLSNAIAYTQPGGSVTVSVEQKGNEVITHVTDTGQGIPKDALPHLFTKFFRVSGALEAGSKGTGLGLYISKAIIDMHHGKIWVDSKLGKGSTFSFALPVATVEETSTTASLQYG